MDIQKLYTQWAANATEDPDIATELASVKDKQDEVEDRFYRDLAFGTGGLRGVIGAGTNRMNIYTVRRATRGIAKWLSSKKNPSAAISYDSRIKSRRFAEETARVFAACGVKAYLYPQLMPTPALSFAVRALHCDAGVMVTASHNPAKYNGYKVYGADGCQITTAAAEEITKCIESIGYFDPLPTASGAQVEEVPQHIFEDFYAAVLAQRLEKSVPAQLKLVYSPLNGTGLVPVTTVLKRAGYTDITVVASQEKPDGNFPTCPYPNPEIPEALQEGLKLCRQTGADLLLATDPDCDRMGIAVRDHKGEYQLLSGNEVGALLLDYVCRRRQALGTMPKAPVAVKTIVTTELAGKIAAHYGVEIRDVLTGFKFIGEQIGFLEKAGQADRYIFGFEESYGYLSGTHVRDKDAVNACLLLCDMAADYKKQGQSLLDAMENIYKSYGCYRNGLDSFAFEGEAGFHIMQNLMTYLRENPPKELNGHKVTLVKDYLHQPGKPVQFPNLPSSDVLQYVLDDDTCMTVRPSGTEPKLKLYTAAVGKTEAEADAACTEYRKAFSAIITEHSK